MRTDGTIRSREAKTVLSDILMRRKVPSAVYKFQGGKLNIMVGSQLVELKCPSGLSYYGLKLLTDKLNSVIDEYEAAKLRRNQIDLEDLLRAPQ